MSRHVPWVLCAALAVVLCVSAITQSNDDPAAGQFSAEEMAEMMEMYMKLSQPGEQHEKLAAMVGEWDVSSKMYWAGPDGPAQESKGKAVFKSIFGGRFIVQHYHGEMTMPDATGTPQTMAFEGIGFTGYDNYKKAYIGTWADSLSTSFYISKGVDNPTKPDAITFYGEMDEPTLGMQDRMAKQVTRFIDKDTFVFTMYDLAVDDDYKVMELTYTRRK